VAVVVVSWNCAAYLPGCLDSLAALAHRPREILVVDNASADGSQALVRERFPGVRLVECRTNVGFAAANNLGIRETRSPFVLVLNPDTRLAPDFLERLLPAFDDPVVGLAAGKLLRFDGRTLDSCGQSLGRSRQPIDRGYGLPDRGQLDRDEDVFGCCGAAALYRRAMLEHVADPGPCFFDEAFFAFFEDLDLAWRARRCGWRAVYRHRAIGFHARGGTSSGGRSRRRFAAMLARSSAVRFHIVKNRYLSILRNDSPGRYVRDAPFIWTRDAATFLFLLALDRGVLTRLWRERAMFGRALALRRLDAERRGHEVSRGTKPMRDGHGRGA
jgi:GT2 family glycosyltransferase